MDRWVLVWTSVLLTCLAMVPARPPARVETPLRAHGHAPPGACVRVQGTAYASSVDATGQFLLPLQGRWTAHLPGHFIAGVPARRGARLHLRALPEHDHPGYAWVDPTPGQPGACGNCHTRAYAGWSTGAHAHSATSADFQHHYGMLLRDKPDGAGVCSSCHAPGLADDDPALFDLRQVRGALAGVHCDYCHKVADLNPGGEIGLTHGRYLLKLLRPREGQLFIGPLDDVDRDEDAYSPLYRDSRYCAACHEGNVFGVPVYTTYSEWRASPAGRRGQQCQDCHSKRYGKEGGRTTPHTFWEGDQQSMLRRSLELEVGFGDHEIELRLTARNVGHRVPTGFIERKLTLTWEYLDANGRVLATGQAIFARRMTVPFWQSEPGEDTRLHPEVPWLHRDALPPGTQAVRTRLTHDRFQTQPSKPLVIAERTWPRER